MAYKEVKEANKHLMTTTTSSDKETVSHETTILEDSTAASSPDNIVVPPQNVSIANNTPNTDGAIYTLTVLNEEDQSPTRNRTLEASINLSDEEENNQFSLLPRHLKECPPIIPHNTPQSQSSSLIQSETSVGESCAGFIKKKNDCTLTSNNTSSEAGSILRNALLGKAFFGSYYAASPKKGEPKKGESVEGPSIEQPSSFATGEITDDCSGDPKQSALMTVPMGGNLVTFDEDGGTRVLAQGDLDNPSSSHNVDDISVSELDAASHTEDYEKLRRSDNQVAESGNQYCSLDQMSTGSPSQTGICISTIRTSAENVVLSSPRQQSTSKSRDNRKYTRKHGGGRKGNSKRAHSSHQMQSNTVRKERSLFYCKFCRKSFKYKSALDTHIRIHTGERPFACPLCSMTCKQKSHLKSHCRRMHNFK